MATQIPHELQQQLAQHQQLHLLQGVDTLNDAQLSQFVRQLKQIDFALIDQLHKQQQTTSQTDSPRERAARAEPPDDLIRLPQTAAEQKMWREAKQRGEDILTAGKVGIILVAGGQGTRLGFPHPKGMFPIGPVTSRTLFQHLIEQASARARNAKTSIPYFIMTSDATHDETIQFLDDKNRFGLTTADLYLFKQGNMLAVDASSGQGLLEQPGQLCLSPDGHGGMLAALAQSGLLDEMKSRGIEYLYYHQVDNPTAIVCDPAFLGFHELHQSEMSTKVVAKRNAQEKMGVVVNVDGTTEIIEYSDMPEEVANQLDANGRLSHWAGNMAIHIFNRSFFERLNNQTDSLPFHVALKAVPHSDAYGVTIQPATPNAHKFERFIFDALPHATTALVVEADRQREFNPVKNEEGNDSPATARAALTAIHREWIDQTDITLPATGHIELSPLFALDAEEFAHKVAAGEECGDYLFTE